MIRIVIADDHAMMREGLKHIVESAVDMELVGETANGLGALDHARKGGFDLLVLDLSMPGLSGAELIHRIRRLAPTLPLLVLTMYEEEPYVRKAIQCGANGVLAKENASEELLVAIRKVAAGELYLPPVIAALLETEF